MSDGPERPPDGDEEKWPIGFLIIVTLVALYLGWRLVQGVIWLFQHL